ncbi:hypothetical protein NSK_003087 [Nannochloropsis salina CCMP1776]|uniref:Transmembrane protein n=1 Tax=Nannochloropsis salina CCMP1776 TaxID=1027361 RepID=A0A4D9DAD7_9STRA|nr:hypothetical protein NSK_003087 [Nannochloropsis salina CCMP1776]|eukprot:TFJ85578.1 hypothetical protein NSK_003087 [Nannochloropsis salina CCMP1776]
MFIQLHFISSWWSGAFSALIGAVGLSSRWECPRMAFRVLTFVGVLLNAVAAVIDARVDHVLRGSEVFCGPPSRATGGASSVSLQDWCALEPEDLAVLSCACIIPGESPGSSKACLAFHGRAPEAESQCYASASLLQRLLSASTGLCWALATICLCACLFRLALTCRYCLILVLSRSSSFPLVPKRWRAESAQSADRKVVAGSETGAEDKKREDPNYLQITYGKMEEGERGPPRAAGRDGGNLARHGLRGQRDVRDAYYLRDVPMPCR